MSVDAASTPIAKKKRRLREGDVVEFQLWGDDLAPVARGMKLRDLAKLKDECGGYVVQVVVVY